MRACGGISRARNSTRPSRPVAVSGAYSLSMQNSVRWVLPVMSASRWRNIRSTSQGATSSPGVICENAISSSARLSCRASSMRGCWLVGPMNRPLNRYERLGWLCQNPSSDFSRSGRRRNGLSAGSAAPITTWLPPPVPTWRPSSMNFSVARPTWRASSYSSSPRCTISLQLDAGCTFTSITPGSGVTEKCSRPRIARRQIAFQHHLAAEFRGGVLDRGDQRQPVLGRVKRREEHVDHAVARLDAERGAHQIRVRRGRSTGSSCTIGRNPSAPAPMAAMRHGRTAWRGGSGGCGANGSGSVSCSIRSGSAQGRLSSGRR